MSCFWQAFLFAGPSKFSLAFLHPTLLFVSISHSAVFTHSYFVTTLLLDTVLMPPVGDPQKSFKFLVGTFSKPTLFLDETHLMISNSALIHFRFGAFADDLLFQLAIFHWHKVVAVLRTAGLLSWADRLWTWRLVSTIFVDLSAVVIPEFHIWMCFVRFQAEKCPKPSFTFRDFIVLLRKSFAAVKFYIHNRCIVVPSRSTQGVTRKRCLGGASWSLAWLTKKAQSHLRPL